MSEVQRFYAASLLLIKSIQWVMLPIFLPFSKTFIWAGANFVFQANILLTPVPFLGTAHVLSLIGQCVGLLTVLSILLLFTFFL